MGQLLKNKIVLITGGNSGIGYATAQKVIKEGAIAVIVGRNARKVNDACQRLGDKSIGFVADVSSPDQLDNLFIFIKKEFKSIHGVVVNAAFVLLANCVDVSENHFDQLVNTNFKGAFFTAQKSLKLIKRGGSIIFNSSLSAHRPSISAGIYAATKAAISSIATTMAIELASSGIRVNSVSPGPIRTPLLTKIGMSKQDIEEYVIACRKKVPLGRAGRPSDIANIMAFLLSDESSFITGANIRADGGVFLAS